MLRNSERIKLRKELSLANVESGSFLGSVESDSNSRTINLKGANVRRKDRRVNRKRKNLEKEKVVIGGRDGVMISGGVLKRAKVGALVGGEMNLFAVHTSSSSSSISLQQSQSNLILFDKRQLDDAGIGEVECDLIHKQIYRDGDEIRVNSDGEMEDGGMGNGDGLVSGDVLEEEEVEEAVEACREELADVECLSGAAVGSGAGNKLRIAKKNARAYQKSKSLRKGKYMNHAKLFTLEEYNDLMVDRYDIGEMVLVCKYCQALHFESELNSRGVYMKCCNGGQVKLKPIKTPSKYVLDLLTGDHEDSKLFYRKSKTFNSNLSFASISLNNYKFGTVGMPAVRISGSVYHNIGSVLKGDSSTAAQFLQVFFHQGSGESKKICGDGDYLDAADMVVLNKLRNEIRTHNAYLNLFVPIVDQCKQLGANLKDYGIVLR